MHDRAVPRKPPRDVVVDICTYGCSGCRFPQHVGISRPCVAKILGGKVLEHGLQRGISVPRAQFAIEDK
jgi:hypothetical protein